MSKPASVQRQPSTSQLPPRSAWSRGPPQVSTPPASSPRSQSPAPGSGAANVHPTHSRRPSALGGNPIAVGMAVSTSVPRAPGKTASPVTFGSIDQPSVPLVSTPPSAPAAQAAAAPKVQSFGSIPSVPEQTPAVNGRPTMSNTNSSASATTSATASPASSAATPGPAKVKPKFDVKKLFQGGGQPSPTNPSFPPAANHQMHPPHGEHPSPVPVPMHMPAMPPQPIPQQSNQAPPRQQFTPYSPVNVPRQLAPVTQQQPPRSPLIHHRQLNGRPGPGPQQSNGSSPAPNSPAMGMQAAPSGPGPGPGPVLSQVGGPPTNGTPPAIPGPHQPGQQPMQMHPQMPWGGYYYPPYPGMPDQQFMSPTSYGWVPQHMAAPPHQTHLQPPHAPHSPAQQPHPISPRAQPPPLTSPPPQSPSISSPSGRNAGLSSAATAFVPRSRAVITIKDPNGREVDLGNHRRASSMSGGVTPPLGTPEKKKAPPVRMESEEHRKARLEAVEREQREKEEKIRLEKEAKEREEREKLEAEKRKLEEEERRKREAEEAERLRKENEEKERIRKEEEEKERIRLEEEEREKERLRKEEEEKERIRLEEEEKERKRKEEEEALEREKELERKRLEEELERKRKDEEAAERIKRLEQEEEERARAAAADAAEEERRQREEAERKKAEEEAAATAKQFEEEQRSVISPPVKPAEHRIRPKPGPLDLSSTHRGDIAPPLPSALATARIIANLEEISYPEGVKSPKIELNQGAKEGKFKYDRDFLLQFMALCKEKPDNLSNTDLLGINPGDAPLTPNPGMSRGGSRGGNRRSISQAMPPPGAIPNRNTPVGLGIPGGFGGKGQGGFQMGQFGMGPNARNVTGPPMGTLPFPGGKPPLNRTSSQGGVGAIPNQPSGLGSGRHRGSRQGKHRTEANRVNSQHGNAPFGGQSQMSTLEHVAPLEATTNRWTPASVGRRPQAVDENSPEIVDKKVKGLLNKLTMERFDSISDQIIEWANKSEKETDGRTLMRVIRHVFEKATDEATWSEMYARLCRKMLETISSDVVDESIKTPDGKPFAGGQLFRKYLLNRCQEDFERGWAQKEATSAAAAAKADDDNKAAAEGEEALYSDEYYAAQKAKRQGLGLVKFIGELFKLQMLTERIMHECIKKLLSNVDNPAEEEIESLCKLLSTVGQQLDTPKAQKHMDVYFARMKELCSSSKIASRIQFMLLDVLDLRSRKWRARTEVAAPTTIAAVHEQAAKEKAAEAYNRSLPMSRGGSRRGEHTRGNYEQQPGPDGWTTAGGPGGPTRPPAKAGDMSMFGKINKTNIPTSFAPGGVFKRETQKIKETGSLSRTASSSNMFSMLNADAAAVEPSLSRGHQTPSRKPSADFSQGGLPDGVGSRKRLQLLPRSLPKPDGDTSTSPVKDANESEPEDGEIREDGLEDGSSIPSVSKQEAERRYKEDVKELFQIRDLVEADEYIKAVPTQYHADFIDHITSKAMESKEADVKFVASYYSQLAEKQLCSAADFEAGFAKLAEFLEDMVVDIPPAYRWMATIIKGAQLPRDAAERLSDKITVEGEPKKAPRDKLLDAYDA